MTAPTFGIFSPYPKTKLAEYAINFGVMDPKYHLTYIFGDLSPLNCFTMKEKRMQLKLVYLGPNLLRFARHIHPSTICPFTNQRALAL